jgi:hypothetical protein
VQHVVTMWGDFSVDLGAAKDGGLAQTDAADNGAVDRVVPAVFRCR